jgi:hypothetical protein
MSLQAADMLDDAFAIYLKVARVPDGNIISRQTPSWEAPKTPYDFAALLCKSLIPATYNFKEQDYPGATQAIWDRMVDQLEILDIDDVCSEILTGNKAGA